MQLRITENKYKNGKIVFCLEVDFHMNNDWTFIEEFDNLDAAKDALQEQVDYNENVEPISTIVVYEHRV